jgi:hypothetical protein
MLHAKNVKKAKTHGWIAGDTSVSDLPKSELSLMCGLQPTKKSRASWYRLAPLGDRVNLKKG